MGWLLVERRYPGGDREITAVPEPRPGSRGASSSADEVSEEERAKRAARAAQARKTALRRAAMSVSAEPVLLTLTTRAAMSWDAIWRAWTRWLRLVGGRRYVVVAERQARGAWHLHAVLDGRQDVRSARCAWYRALGASPDATGSDAPGSLNLSAPRGRDAGRSAARYCAKYLGKGLASAPGRLWRRSVGLAPETVRHYRDPAPLEWVVQAVARMLHVEQSAVWSREASGRDPPVVWASTWTGCGAVSQ